MLPLVVWRKDAGKSERFFVIIWFLSKQKTNEEWNQKSYGFLRHNAKHIMSAFDQAALNEHMRRHTEEWEAFIKTEPWKAFLSFVDVETNEFGLVGSYQQLSEMFPGNNPGALVQSIVEQKDPTHYLIVRSSTLGTTWAIWRRLGVAKRVNFSMGQMERLPKKTVCEWKE